MLKKIKQILESEAAAIKQIPIDNSLIEAVNVLSNCHGKVFTTGIGKAGYVARKAASTFSTTGTPAVFLHPGDAPHGDVGVLTDKDVLVTFSNSGKTREIIETVLFSRQLGVKSVITITGNSESPLSIESDITLNIGKIEEPCPFGFTPSASTSAMCAIADALALVAMEERGITKEDFAIRHHGGYLGEQSRKAISRVANS